MRFIGAIVCALALGAGCAGVEPATPAPGVNKAGEIAYRLTGAGEPRLVFLSGLGDGMATFDRVAAQLSADATVFVYDRPGYGGSAATAKPRDAETVAAELEAALNAAGVGAPYVLVGHSLGGLYAEYFAATRPGKVKALVLSDARPATFTAACKAKVEPPTKCEPPALIVKLFPPHMRAEVDALTKIEAQVRAAPPAKVPALVLSQGKAGAEGASFHAAWKEEQKVLGARYGASPVYAPQAGHYVHRDAEALFVQSVRAFIKTLT